MVPIASAFLPHNIPAKFHTHLAATGGIGYNAPMKRMLITRNYHLMLPDIIRGPYPDHMYMPQYIISRMPVPRYFSPPPPIQEVLSAACAGYIKNSSKPLTTDMAAAILRHIESPSRFIPRVHLR